MTRKDQKYCSEHESNVFEAIWQARTRRVKRVERGMWLIGGLLLIAVIPLALFVYPAMGIDGEWSAFLTVMTVALIASVVSTVASVRMKFASKDIGMDVDALVMAISTGWPGVLVHSQWSLAQGDHRRMLLTTTHTGVLYSVHRTRDGNYFFNATAPEGSGVASVAGGDLSAVHKKIGARILSQNPSWGR